MSPAEKPETMTAARFAPATRLDTAPPYAGYAPRLASAAALRDALRGLDLGDFDQRIIHWLSGWEREVVAGVVCWLRRVRQYAQSGQSCGRENGQALRVWDAPLEFVLIGDDAWRCRTDGTSGWEPVKGIFECEDDQCPHGDQCAGVVWFAHDSTEHIPAGECLTIRIPDDEWAEPVDECDGGDRP